MVPQWEEDGQVVIPSYEEGGQLGEGEHPGQTEGRDQAELLKVALYSQCILSTIQNPRSFVQTKSILAQFISY